MTLSDLAKYSMTQSFLLCRVYTVSHKNVPLNNWSDLFNLFPEGEDQRHPRSPLCSVLCSSDGFRHCRPDPVFNIICPPPSWSALLPCASYTFVEQEGTETICFQHTSEILPLYVFQQLTAVVQSNKC